MNMKKIVTAVLLVVCLEVVVSKYSYHFRYRHRKGIFNGLARSKNQQQQQDQQQQQQTDVERFKTDKSVYNIPNKNNQKKQKQQLRRRKRKEEGADAPADPPADPKPEPEKKDDPPQDGQQDTAGLKAVKADEPDQTSGAKPLEEEEDPMQVVYNDTKDEKGRTIRQALVTPQFKDGEAAKYSQIAGGEGKDIYRSYYTGQFYLIQKYVDKKFPLFSGKVSFYINRHAMYYTAPSAQTSASDNYRNVMGSIDLDNIISASDDLNVVIKGDCCRSIGHIKPFMNTRISDSESLNDIQKRVRDTLRSNQIRDQVYGIDAATRNIVQNKFFWQAFMCFQVSMQNGGRVEPNVWTICSPNKDDINIINMELKEYIITKVNNEKGYYALTFLLQNQRTEESSSENYSIKEQRWEYSSESTWSETCKLRNNQGYVQSPIYLSDDLFYETDEQKYKQLGLNMKDSQVQDYFKELMTKKSPSQLKSTYGSVIDALNSYRFKNPIDIETDKLLQKSKKYLKVFTFNGLHENYFIGDFGQMTLVQRKGAQQDYEMFRKTNDQEDGKQKIEKEIIMKAFAMTIKMGSELSQMDGAEHVAEVQVYMYQTGQDECDEYLSNNVDTKLQGKLMQIIYKQFYLGKHKQESDDIYLADHYIKKCTHYVLTIPLSRKANMPHDNNFIRTLLSEDMFELQPSPDYLNDYLQTKMTAIQYSKDLAYKDIATMQEDCKYPGNIQCLFAQQDNQMSFYIYKGTLTQPPCTRAVHIVLKNSYFVTPGDLNLIQEQMFAYRSNTRNIRPNTRTGINYEDVKTFGIYKMMDYYQSECEKINGVAIISQGDRQSGYSRQDLYYRSSTSRKYKEIQTQLTKIKQKYTEVHKKSINEQMTVISQSDQRYIRRMVFVNPQLSNDLLKMLRKGESGAYEEYQGLNGKTSYDYGDDDKNVLFVKGKLKSTLVGYMTSRESVKVNNVIKKYRDNNLKTGDTNSVSIENLSLIPEPKLPKTQDDKR